MTFLSSSRLLKAGTHIFQLQILHAILPSWMYSRSVKILWWPIVANFQQLCLRNKTKHIHAAISELTKVIL